MKKLYALVKPPYTFTGQGLLDLPYLFLTPVYQLMYEHICTYTLGHDVEFFDSLQEAQDVFNSAIATGRESVYIGVVQNAIIELEYNGVNITKFLKMHTVNDIKSPRNGNSLFRTIGVAWEQKTIGPDDVSSDALYELNRQYKHNLQPVAQGALR